MSEKITNIAKNTSYFTLALILQKVISFTYFTILARNLVPDDLGKYYFAMSFTTIFAVLIDLGFANILTRETAKRQDEAGSLLGSILAMKLPLMAVAITATIITIHALGYPSITRDLVYLSTICMVLDSFTVTFYAIIRGFHNLKFESLASIIYQLIALCFGLTVLRLGLGLRWLMGAFVLASIYNFLYSGGLAILKFKLRLAWQKSYMREMALLTIPFGLYGILQRLYTYLDTVLLSKLAGDFAVGLYQIAFKIIFALQFLPMAFTATLYPAFSSYWRNNRDQLVVTFERAMNYLIIIALPISIGTISIADKIVLIFKSDYIDAVLPLRLSIAALLFNFVNFPVGSLLNSCDRQKINTLNMAITVAASISLNLLIIPYTALKYGNGAIGASLTVLLTNVLMLGLGLRVVPKIIAVRPMKILSVFFKGLAASLVMAVLVFALKSYLNILIVVILGGLVYFVGLFLTKAYSKEDVSSILQSFKKKVV